MTRMSLGARWRAMLRYTLGKPGALPRWLLGSALAFIATALVVKWTGWYPLLLVIVIPIVGWLPLRANLEGDEDELNAEYPGKVIEAIRQSVVSPEDLEDYFTGPVDERAPGVIDWPDIPRDFPATPLQPIGQDSDEGVEWVSDEDSDT